MSSIMVMASMRSMVATNMLNMLQTKTGDAIARIVLNDFNLVNLLRPLLVFFEYLRHQVGHRPNHHFHKRSRCRRITRRSTRRARRASARRTC